MTKMLKPITLKSHYANQLSNQSVFVLLKGIGGTVIDSEDQKASQHMKCLLS